MYKLLSLKALYMCINILVYINKKLILIANMYAKKFRENFTNM